jgi:hypothetical protein
MSSTENQNSNQADKWRKGLEIAGQVFTIVAAVVTAANGIDSYVHHHPHGLNNHDDWKG